MGSLWLLSNHRLLFCCDDNLIVVMKDEVKGKGFICYIVVKCTVSNTFLSC